MNTIPIDALAIYLFIVIPVAALLGIFVIAVMNVE